MSGDSKDNKSGDPECIICHSRCEEGGETKFECNHNYFHEECINEWLRVGNTCPYCRAPYKTTGYKNKEIDWENLTKYNWSDISLISSINWSIVDWRRYRCWHICKTNKWYDYIDWDNKYLVITILEHDWEDLQYCSTRLRDDYDVVMAALSDYGLALMWASERLKDNEEIVKYAISGDGQYSWAYEKASKRLKENEEIVKLAMRNPRVYTVIPKKFQNNYDYALAAVKIDWKIYKKSVKNIKGLNKNPEIIKAALEQSEEVLEYLPPKIKKLYTNTK